MPTRTNALPALTALGLCACALLGCPSAPPAEPPATAPDKPAPGLTLTQVPFTADSASLGILCGALIDGLADAPLANQRLIVEDGRITAIGPTLEFAHALPVLDLSSYTCAPGLIDMHTHIMESPDDTADLSVYFTHTLEKTLSTGRKLAHRTLLSGFTSVRNLGVYYGFSSAQLRDEIAAGQSLGPRMQIAGTYLTIPGGGGDLLVPDVDEADVPAHLRLGVSSGEAAFAQAAQAAIARGADVIKVIASGAVLAYGGVPGAPEMSEAEIAAVVEVAERANIRVAAHAHGAESIKQAIRAGVSTVEHASLLDEEAIEMAARHQVALSMDVYGGDWIAEEGRRQNWPDEFIRKNDETTLAQRQGFKKAHAAGVPIVFGSDAGIYPHGLNGRQFAYMVQWGMSPMEAIKAATSLAAKYMGWEAQVGSLQVGRYADLIALDGDPLAQIKLMEQPVVVIKGGHLIKAPDALLAR